MPFISFEVDEELKSQIERAVEAENIDGETDRSKWIRKTLKQAIKAGTASIETLRPTDADEQAETVVRLLIPGRAES